MTFSGRTSDNGLKSMKLIDSFTIGSLRGFCDGEDGDRDGELVALGESGGEALCDRGGEGGKRVLCLQVSIIDIRCFLETKLNL
ncbi:hypothetical protein Tco_1448052 [Tanacetum coccineum]